MTTATAPTCACGKPAPDTAICRACTADLTHQLERLGPLWAELETRLTGERGIDYTSLGGSKASEVPLAIDPAAYELRDTAMLTLSTWTRLLLEERQVPR